MAKLKSSLVNMTLSLTIITIVAALALSGIYTLTKTQIEEQEQKAKEAAKIAVLNGCADGYAIETSTNGFGGKMRVMVGFDSEGNVLGYEILEHSETPGLGDKAVKWFKDSTKPKQCIIGRSAAVPFKVSKDGGDVDAITAATISSRAFLKAVNEAYNEWNNTPANETDAVSSATTVEDNWIKEDSVNVSDTLAVESTDVQE